MAEKREIFPGLIGNEKLKSIFSSSIPSGRTAHAYILDGIPGSGKHTAARMIAAACSCEHRSDAGYPLPCGQCPSCRKILADNSVDLMTLSREKDKASLSVDKIREMRDTLYYTPNDGDRKYYIIEEAETMTPQAQNALLLTLEEPPSFVMFFLLCADSNYLLPTILSRAPKIQMERFSPVFIEDYLMEKHPKLDRNVANEAAHLAEGALGAAEKLTSKSSKELKYYGIAEKTAEIIVKGSKTERFLYVSALPQKDRAALSRILSLTRVAVRDMIASKKGGDLLFFNTLKGIPSYAKNLSVRRLAEIYAALVTAENDVAANCSVNTLLMNLMINTQKG